MKTVLYLLALAILFVVACQSDRTENSKLVVATAKDSIQYACPMACQGDTAYTTEGKCPVCEMDLEIVQ